MSEIMHWEREYASLYNVFARSMRASLSDKKRAELYDAILKEFTSPPFMSDEELNEVLKKGNKLLGNI